MSHTVWTLVETVYGGHDRTVSVRAYANVEALLPSLRQALVDAPMDEGQPDPLDPKLDFDDLLALTQEASDYEPTHEIAVYETTVYETPTEEAQERADFQAAWEAGRAQREAERAAALQRRRDRQQDS
jgi:hypothetical protein